MVAGQNLHPLTSSPESVGYSADVYAKMKAKIAMHKAKIAIHEGKLRNLHSRIIGPESVGFSADQHQYLQNLLQQTWAELTIQKGELENDELKLTILKGELENDELKAQLARLEGKLHIQHRNTPSCPLPSDSASLSQPNLETTTVSWQPVSPEAQANRAETDVSPNSTRVRHSVFLADVRPSTTNFFIRLHIKTRFATCGYTPLHPDSSHGTVLA